MSHLVGPIDPNQNLTAEQIKAHRQFNGLGKKLSLIGIFGSAVLAGLALYSGLQQMSGPVTLATGFGAAVGAYAFSSISRDSRRNLKTLEEMEKKNSVPPAPAL